MGLPYNKVLLEAYNCLWPKHFAEEKESILEAVHGGINVQICHIGSTAIPGIFAKPIIDILVGVEKVENFDSLSKTLFTLGYKCLGDCGRPERLFFVKGNLGNCTHHLHMVKLESEYWQDYLLFRDHLLTEKVAAKFYSQAK